MPSPVLLIPFLQHLADKRKPKPESDDVEQGEQRGQLSGGNQNLGGKFDSSPAAKWEIVREKVNEGNLAQEVERRRRGTVWRRIKDYMWGQEDEESRGEYIPNYRWTPILSGVIIPFAILLEIPGLTEHWYIRTDGNKTVETQENPRILDAGLAISMASAVLANIALICRFLERRVRLATFIAIGGLIIHEGGRGQNPRTGTDPHAMSSLGEAEVNGTFDAYNFDYYFTCRFRETAELLLSRAHSAQTHEESVSSNSQVVNQPNISEALETGQDTLRRDTGADDLSVHNSTTYLHLAHVRCYAASAVNDELDAKLEVPPLPNLSDEDNPTLK